MNRFIVYDFDEIAGNIASFNDSPSRFHPRVIFTLKQVVKHFETLSRKFTRINPNTKMVLGSDSEGKYCQFYHKEVEVDGAYRAEDFSSRREYQQFIERPERLFKPKTCLNFFIHGGGPGHVAHTPNHAAVGLHVNHVHIDSLQLTGDIESPDSLIVTQKLIVSLARYLSSIATHPRHTVTVRELVIEDLWASAEVFGTLSTIIESCSSTLDTIRINWLHTQAQGEDIRRLGRAIGKCRNLQYAMLKDMMKMEPTDLRAEGIFPTTRLTLSDIFGRSFPIDCRQKLTRLHTDLKSVDDVKIVSEILLHTSCVLMQLSLRNKSEEIEEEEQETSLNSRSVLDDEFYSLGNAIGSCCSLRGLDLENHFAHPDPHVQKYINVLTGIKTSVINNKSQKRNLVVVDIKPQEDASVAKELITLMPLLPKLRMVGPVTGWDRPSGETQSPLHRAVYHALILHMVGKNHDIANTNRNLLPAILDRTQQQILTYTAMIECNHKTTGAADCIYELLRRSIEHKKVFSD